MASITLTIPDALASRVIDGMCGRHGYEDQVRNPEDEAAMIPNPETKSAFMKRIIMQKIKHDVLEWESSEAGKQARQVGETEIQL